MVIAVSGAAFVIMLSGIAATALMENQMRRQREEELRVQNRRFDMALDNMGEGLCMFDAGKRLVVCNKRYAKMYRLPPELLKTGTPHSAIIRHRVLHGILKGETSDERGRAEDRRTGGAARRRVIEPDRRTRRRPPDPRHPAADGGRRLGRDASRRHRAAAIGGEDRLHGAARRADRSAEPRAAARAAGARARSTRRGGRAWRCSCSISTASRRSTTRSDIRSATGC